jgi:hypothetical protein
VRLAEQQGGTAPLADPRLIPLSSEQAQVMADRICTQADAPPAR